MSTSFIANPGTSPQRVEFYSRLGEKHTAPLWEVLNRLVLTEPRTACVPAIWQYMEMRPLLLETGQLITAAEAERRVIVLENPALHGKARITQSLYAGLQLLLPGETARSHRHTASAMRFVIEGEGAYTAVDGQQMRMRPGDFVLTPSWSFHDHGNPGTEPVIWLDCLDAPIVNLFDTSFAEHRADEIQPPAPADRGGSTSAGGDFLPAEYRSLHKSSAVFNYPYVRTREVLDRLHRKGTLDPHDGVKLQYVNPNDGEDPMPTIAAFMQLMPRGFEGRRYRSTDATIFSVVEGFGRTTIGDTTLEWGPRDVFVVPSWQYVFHTAREDSVIFSCSDRAAQKKLGLWREERV